MGCSFFPDMTVYTTSHATSSILEHEFGHIYDYNFFITFNQNHQDIIPPDVLISNQNAVCEAVSESNSFEHCMSSYHETFADAMALYVESPDKLPPDLKSMDGFSAKNKIISLSGGFFKQKKKRGVLLLLKNKEKKVF